MKNKRKIGLLIFVPYFILFLPFYLLGFIYYCSIEAFKVGGLYSKTLLDRLQEIINGK